MVVGDLRTFFFLDKHKSLERFLLYMVVECCDQGQVFETVDGD